MGEQSITVVIVEAREYANMESNDIIVRNVEVRVCVSIKFKRVAALNAQVFHEKNTQRKSVLTGSKKAAALPVLPVHTDDKKVHAKIATLVHMDDDNMHAKIATYVNMETTKDIVLHAAK
jgi:hypothetical protein